MLPKLKNLANHPYIHQLRDIRVLGLVAFGFIVLLVSWSGVKVIDANYKLEREVAQLQQENEVFKLQNTNQKLKNQFYNTDEYLELQARRQFGKAAPGEKVVLVPKNVALANSVEPQKPSSEELKKITPHKPFYQKNIEAWMSFFFHRQIGSE